MTSGIQIHKIHGHTSNPQHSRLNQNKENQIRHRFLQVDQGRADSGDNQGGYEDQARSGGELGDGQVDEEEEEAAGYSGVDCVG